MTMNQTNTEGYGANAQHQQAQTATQDASQGLAWAVSTIARVQGKTVDRLRLHQAVTDHQAALATLTQAAGEVSQLWQSTVRAIVASAGIDAIEV